MGLFPQSGRRFGHVGQRGSPTSACRRCRRRNTIILASSASGRMHDPAQILGISGVKILDESFAQPRPVLDDNASFFLVRVMLGNDARAHDGDVGHTPLDLVEHRILRLYAVRVADLGDVAEVRFSDASRVRREDAALVVVSLVVKRRLRNGAAARASVDTCEEQQLVAKDVAEVALVVSEHAGAVERAAFAVFAKCRAELGQTLVLLWKAPMRGAGRGFINVFLWVVWVWVWVRKGWIKRR